MNLAVFYDNGPGGTGTEIYNELGNGVNIAKIFSRKMSDFIKNNDMLKQAGLQMGRGFVYVGLGNEDDADIMDKTRAYIGQAADMNRFLAHINDKSWICRFIIIRHPILDDEGPRKAYERQLIIELFSSGRYEVENDCLANKDKEDVVIGIGTRETIATVHNSVTKLVPKILANVCPFRARSGKKIASENKIHIERNSKEVKDGINQPYAFGEWKIDGGIAILKGSYCCEIDRPLGKSISDKTRKIYDGIKASRDKLIHKGIIKATLPGLLYPYIFEDDYYFPKPTTAAQIIIGKSTSGYDAWIQTDTGKTIEQVRSEQECLRVKKQEDKITDVEIKVDDVVKISQEKKTESEISNNIKEMPTNLIFEDNDLNMLSA